MALPSSVAGDLPAPTAIPLNPVEQALGYVIASRSLPCTAGRGSGSFFPNEVPEPNGEG